MIETLGEHRERYITRPGLPAFDVEPRLKPPLTIIGARKPNRSWFFIWDANVSVFRDILNPDVYLTFSDAHGRYVGPIRYFS